MTLVRNNKICGDPKTNNFTYIEANGRETNFGDAASIEDITIPLSGAVASGSEPPEFKFIKNDGAGVPIGGKSYEGNGVDSFGSITTSAVNDDLNFDDQSFSICFWMKPSNAENNKRILFRDKNYDFKFKGSNTVEFKFQNLGNRLTTTNFDIGQRNCVVIVSTQTGAVTEQDLYINNVLVDSTSQNKLIESGSDTNPVYLGCKNGSVGWMTGFVDELRFYNTNISVAKISNYWNGGLGTEKSLVNLTDTDLSLDTELIAAYHFNAIDGSTNIDNAEGTAVYDMSASALNLSSTDDELIVTVLGSRGIYNYAFPPDRETEMHFACQFPHAYVYGSEIYPHVHYLVREMDETVGGGLLIENKKYRLTAGTFDAHVVDDTFIATAQEVIDFQTEPSSVTVNRCYQISFGFEFIWQNIFSKSDADQDTTTITTDHYITGYPYMHDLVIWGNSVNTGIGGVQYVSGNPNNVRIDLDLPNYGDDQIKIASSMIVGRVYRNTNSPNDDYPYDVFLLEADFHILLDSNGSDGTDHLAKYKNNIVPEIYGKV